ncbi:Homeodomain-like superfamily protein [Striga hermonthica]|uniref:Homeodomain-like superfamily protein n=1 Tax=Striga hermonthica TaxID=68872 RepID=A0A9N7RK76_STRHE|nr:Homeodomain-like superfamily protein [Striga hermonthica]
MAFYDVNSKELKLVLSGDAKPRLKWTQELHHKFVKAVDQLGGPEKATPKSLKKVMGINGLTLYHLKSHLQKYRTGKSQQMQTHHQTEEKNDGEKQRNRSTGESCDGSKEHVNENLQITRALQIQMEVQRKLHEQIEVQKHLQLRIEAQGKYLQSVLLKAQETLTQYSSCSIEAEQAKARLSRLSSMVDSECTSGSFSVLTQSEEEEYSISEYEKEKCNLLRQNGSLLESSLHQSSNYDVVIDPSEPEDEAAGDQRNRRANRLDGPRARRKRPQVRVQSRTREDRATHRSAIHVGWVMRRARQQHARSDQAMGGSRKGAQETNAECTTTGSGDAIDWCKVCARERCAQRLEAKASTAHGRVEHMKGASGEYAAMGSGGARRVDVGWTARTTDDR